MNIDNMNTKNTGTGLTVNRDEVTDTIIEKQFYHFPGTNHIVCCIKMRNGFTMIGDSSCVADENYDADVGRMWAYENAVGRAIDFESYMLKQRLFTFGK